MQQEYDRLTKLREKIEKPVIQEMCNRIHHSTYSLDDLVESIESYLEDFYIKGENVEFTPGTDRSDLEKKFSARHKPDDFCFSYEQAMQQEYDRLTKLREKIEKPVIQEMCNRIHHSTYSLDDLVESIESYLEDFYIKGENVEFTPGTDRTVLAKVTGVEKKGGAVFYTLLYDDKEIGRINGRRSKIEEGYKKEYGIKDKLAPIFCSHSKSANKIVNTTERSEIAKDEDSDSDTPLVNFIPQRRSGDLTKFVCVGSVNGEHKSGEATGTPFLTPQKRSEKSYTITAAAWGAKVLSGVQIDKIPHECHRFAVRKAYDKVKDAEILKKMKTKEERAAFRDKMREQRHQHQKIMLAKIKAYFSQEIAEEDIVVNDAPLPCPGRPVSVPSGQSLLLTDCLVFTQFFSSLKKFIEADHKITAKQLFDAVHEGRPGFMKCTAKLFGSLLKTLLQDPEYRKLTHFNARLHEFSIEDNTVSELCRALLLGSTGSEDE
ncbi:hypothetical protein OSTOST_12187, partial [Ostertagia ostertagi]